MLALGTDQGSALLLRFNDQTYVEEVCPWVLVWLSFVLLFFFLSWQTVDLKHVDDVVSLKFSPDGQFLASGSKDKSVRVHAFVESPNVYDQALMCQFGLDRVYALDFNIRGNTLLAGSGPSFALLLKEGELGEERGIGGKGKKKRPEARDTTRSKKWTGHLEIMVKSASASGSYSCWATCVF